MNVKLPGNSRNHDNLKDFSNRFQSYQKEAEKRNKDWREREREESLIIHI